MKNHCNPKYDHLMSPFPLKNNLQILPASPLQDTWKIKAACSLLIYCNALERHSAPWEVTSSIRIEARSFKRFQQTRTPREHYHRLCPQPLKCDLCFIVPQSQPWKCMYVCMCKASFCSLTPCKQWGFLQNFECTGCEQRSSRLFLHICCIIRSPYDFPSKKRFFILTI